MRIGAKLALSRLPAQYRHWRKLNLFAHGAMHHADYALGVFKQHFEHFRSRPGVGFTVLEIGPGDSVSSALIAAAHGASRVYLVDAGMFATQDMTVYRDLAADLRRHGLAPPDIDGARHLDDVLRACNAVYGVRGLTSLQEIPTATVDFIWSHAVLEHVRRCEFEQSAREMRRVLRTPGVCSHQIDLQDHLGGALNNLRIPSSWWEKPWMANSGFYTNRLRMSEIIEAFASAGFAVNVVAARRWQQLPTPRRAFAREFQHLSDDDLAVSGLQVTLRPI
jgi:hypothetical protein